MNIYVKCLCYGTGFGTGITTILFIIGGMPAMIVANLLWTIIMMVCILSPTEDL
jgi:hypothetical protein